MSSSRREVRGRFPFMARPEDMYREISSSRKFFGRFEEGCWDEVSAGRFLRFLSSDFREAIWSSTEIFGWGFFGAGGGDGVLSSTIIGTAAEKDVIGAGVVRSIVSGTDAAIVFIVFGGSIALGFFG